MYRIGQSIEMESRDLGTEEMVVVGAGHCLMCRQFPFGVRIKPWN